MKPRIRLAPLILALTVAAGSGRGEEALKLPDILAGPDGQQVTTVEQWRTTVRPKTLELFREHVYGRNPIEEPEKAHWQISPVSEQGSGGFKISDCEYQFSGPGGKGAIKVRLVQPVLTDKPAPLFLLINNRSPALADLAKPNGFWPAVEIAKRGYATAIFHVADVDPDKSEGFKDGVHAIFDQGPRKPDAWATIAAWSWGASRVVGELRKMDGIDPDRIAVVGHSRGGKAALWCGAQDERVALTISNDSGCTGAALSRRPQGETVADINKGFPHWFCENYKRFNGREQDLPVDQHQLIGLLAPRLAYVASARDDAWADPEGEFLSCVHATPVYRLHGVKGVEGEAMPETGGHLHGGRIGYHIRPGKHDLTPADWKLFMDFANRHWR